MQNNRQKKFIALLLVLAVFTPRLLSLGTTLTVDEPLWQGRGAQLLRAFSTGNFKKTLVAGQPGVTTAWLVGIADQWGSLAAHQAAISIATGMLILVISYFLTILWGWKWGMIAGFFLALDPFLLGHSRLVHTDALLALFYLSSLVALLAGLEPLHSKKKGKVKRNYIIFSAMLAGGALLTKMFALLLIPSALGITTYTFIKARYGFRNSMTIIFLWLTILLVTVYALWPVLWFNSNTALDYLTSRVALHAEGTRSEEATSEHWYYLREGLFRITPPVTILFFFALFGVIKSKLLPMRRTALWLLIAGLLYALALSVSADKSDRYILFSTLTITLFSVFGLSYALSLLKNNFKQVGLIIPIAICSWLAIDVIRIHPYYLAHYNRLYPIEENHKLGWGEGLEQAADWITDQNPNAKVSSYYHRVFSYFYDGPSESASYAQDNNSDYIVLYRSMFERGPNHPDTDILNKYLIESEEPPVKTITINGLPYVWIVKPN